MGDRKLSIYQSILERGLTVLMRICKDDPRGGPVQIIVYKIPVVSGNTEIVASGETYAEALADLETLTEADLDKVGTPWEVSAVDTEDMEASHAN